MIFSALAREFLSVLAFNWIKACESSFLQLPFSINNLRQLESILESFSLSSGAHQSILAERVAEEYEEYEEPSKCKVSSSRVQETTRGMTKDFVAVHRRKKSSAIFSNRFHSWSRDSSTGNFTFESIDQSCTIGFRLFGIRDNGGTREGKSVESVKGSVRDFYYIKGNQAIFRVENFIGVSSRNDEITSRYPEDEI